MAELTLPFPPASLSGHNNGNWRSKAAIVEKHRSWARLAAQQANFTAPDGDLLLTVTFIPPNNRSDRVNFPNRMKPYFDGIADALGVNDARFLPRYLFAKAQAPGQVHVHIKPVQQCHEGGLPISTRKIAS